MPAFHPCRPVTLKQGEYFYFNGLLYRNRHTEQDGWVFPSHPFGGEYEDDVICETHVHRSQIIVAEKQKDGTYAPAKE